MTMNFKEALEQLKEITVDLTSLEVKTYVGDVNVVIDGITDGTNFEASLSQAKVNGDITLSLVTKLEFDGDGTVLVPSSAPANYVQEAHDAALAAGNKVRNGLISLFSEVTGLKVTT